MKVSRDLTGGRYTLPASNRQGRWLVKLPSSTMPSLPVNEFATMSLARAVGIEVPAFALVHRDEVAEVPSAWWHGEDWGYAIRRFDRGDDGTRVHMEDLAQVRGVFPPDKCHGSFESAAAYVYRDHDERSLTEFARRLAFQLAVGDVDGHLKNWALIYPDSRRPTLSPAYDLVTVSAYFDLPEVDQRLPMRLADRLRLEHVGLDDLDRLARKIGADLPLAELGRDIARRVAENLARLEQWCTPVPDLTQKMTAAVRGRLDALRRTGTTRPA